MSRRFSSRLRNAFNALRGVRDPHFVEDYRRLVRSLMRKHPLDTAMSLAVGGDYDAVGELEAALLLRAGLKDGMRVLDLGCGSGRLACALARSRDIAYLGIDIIPELLDYARTKAPGYEFLCHRGYDIPRPDGSADLCCAFSLFTHLHQAESYLYLEELRRVTRPGGRIVFSFLEFEHPEHWRIFLDTKAMTRSATATHLNMFLDRNSIRTWAGRLGLELLEFLDADFPLWQGRGLGQAAVLLERPRPAG